MIRQFQHIGLYLTIIASANGQVYKPDVLHVSLKGGLSQNTATELIQDSHGFLWIGTQDGLNKYDGYEFKVYRSKEGDTTTLTNNFIKAIAIDSNDNLWLGTQIGLTKFNTEDGIFSQYLKNNDTLSNGQRNVITDLIVNKNEIWIGTESGLLHVRDLNRPEFTLIEDVPQNSRIRQMALDDQDNLWIATDNGEIYRYDSNKKLYQIQIEQWIDSPSIRCVSYFDDKIWLGTSNGIWTIQKENIVFGDAPIISIGERVVQEYVAPVDNFDVLSIFRDSNGKIWVGTQMDGLYILDDKKKNFVSVLTNAEENQRVLESTSVGEIFEDKYRNLWVGTVETGLFKIMQSSKKFGLLRTTPSQKPSLTSNRIRGLMKKGNTIWIGTANGITLFDRSNMKYNSLQNEVGNSNSISSNDVKAIASDQKGYIWVGTNLGLNRIHLPSMKIQRFFANQKESNALVLENRIRSVVSLSDGNIWVGTYGGGLSVIDPVTLESVKHYKHEANNPMSISSNNVMNIFEDSEGSVWISTYGGGLNRLIAGGGTWQRISSSDSTDFPELLSTISEDKNGNLWIGTYGHGIIKLDRGNLSYQVYTEKDGLSNNVTYASIPTDDHLWISTNYGINRLNFESGLFTNYNVNNGLQSNEFNSNSYLICESGEIFFGGVNGLTFFYPDSIYDNRLVPDLVFTDFKIFNKSVVPNEIVLKSEPPLTKFVDDSSRVTLSHFHNVFTIEFAALDFLSPEDINYAHRLVGFDKDWIYSSSDQRSATYTNLKPGEYQFQMKASNNDGIWNENPITLLITIKPSLWQTWWFRLFIGISLLSLISLLIYRRINKVELRKKYLESKIQEHTKEISNQNLQLKKSAERLKNLNRKKDQMFYLLAHNVRAPLTTLKALFSHFNSSNENSNSFKEYLDGLNQNVTESIQLLDNTFYWSKLQFEDIYLSKDYITLDEIVKVAVCNFEKELAAKNITVNIDVEQIDLICDRRMLIVILHNLIRNAIKYSYKDSVIKIVGKSEIESIRLKVQDNGIGLSDEEVESLFDEERNINKLGTTKEKGTGLGLLLSNKLAKYMGYQLSVENDSTFTSFNLEIPKEV